MRLIQGRHQHTGEIIYQHTITYNSDWQSMVAVILRKSATPNTKDSYQYRFEPMKLWDLWEYQFAIPQNKLEEMFIKDDNG